MSEKDSKSKKRKIFIREAKKIGKKKVTLGSVIFTLTIVLIAVAFVLPKAFQKEGSQNIVSENTLEKVVKTSTLSTYETVYNGIVPVMNEKNPDKIDYYISYEAVVKAGLEFDKIKISKDDINKTILVKLPSINLLEPTVDEKLDYIIVNRKVDENGLFAEAYKIAKADVVNESMKQETLLSYATKNAQNLVKGLLSPFVNQLKDYEIIFE